MIRNTPIRLLLFLAAVLVSCSIVKAQSSSKIIFADNAGSLLLINSDGTGQSILLQGTHIQNDNPVYSPDGSKIAFNRRSGFRTDICVINADGTNLITLTSANPQLEFSESLYPAWSPDGSKLAFATNWNGQRKFEIWVMNANGTGLVQLTTNVQQGSDFQGPLFSSDSEPAWSPDGSRIAFSSNRDGRTDTELYVMNADGSNQTRLTDNAADDRNPTWSPDSLRIAFDRNNGGGINIVNRDGTNPVNVTPDCFSPSWSPDGEKFVCLGFDTSNNFEIGIFTMNANGTNRTKITNNNFSARAPSWAPPSSPPIPTFTISGVIKDGNGTPVSGVNLQMFATFSRSTQSGADGAYSFPGLPTGNYRIDISKQGFGFVPSTLLFNNLSTNQTANITAFNAFSISGKVNGVSGGLLVVLTGTQNRTVLLDAGEYSFNLLPAGGNYTVSITSKIWNITPGSITFNNLSANQVANFDAVLAKYNITGTITRLGSPKQGVTVELRDNTGFTPPTTVTDANGQYSFNNVNAGNYSVRPVAANYIFNPQSSDFLLDGNKTADFTALSTNHLLFTQSSRNVVEGAASVQFTVVRGGNCCGVGPITVKYTTEDLTAKAGEDYTAVSGTLEFPEGTFQRTITIPILNDQVRESTEQFSIKLTDPTGEVDLANPSTAVINITDNEPVLVTEANSDRAITLNAVSLVAAPFSVMTEPNYSADKRTRISLFTENIQFGPVFPKIVVTAVDIQQTQFVLTLEAVIGFTAFPFNQLIVRLPENLSPGDLMVTITVDGQPSNAARISVKP